LKKVIFNEDKLTEKDITKTRYKVRAIIYNNSHQFLIIKYAGLYMFPGGSIEKNEVEEFDIKREVQEETGINLDKDKIIPFLQIESFDKNSPDRSGKILNRKTITKYYLINTEKNINIKKINLTENEKQGNLSQKFIKLDEIINLVLSNDSSNIKRRQFDREILEVIKELKIQKIFWLKTLLNQNILYLRKITLNNK